MKALDLGRIRDGAVLVELLPYLEQEIAAGVKATENRVFGLIRENALTPEVALAAWYEVKAQRDLLSRLQSRTRVGATLGEKNKAHLEKGLPNGQA